MNGTVGVAGCGGVGSGCWRGLPPLPGYPHQAAQEPSQHLPLQPGQSISHSLPRHPHQAAQEPTQHLPLQPGQSISQ